MNHNRNTSGFTIIELTLAMTFISFLLLGIALTIIQIGAQYNQGTTAKEINQAARDIDDDLSRTVSMTSSVELSNDYVLTPSTTNPAGGRLCLGTYSYIWNYAKAIANNAPQVTKYEALPTAERRDTVLFAKVPDQAKSYCLKSSTGALTYPNIRVADAGLVQELLKPGDHELGVHNFSFVDPATVPATVVDASTGQRLYTLNFTIGTTRIAALNGAQSACLPSGEPNADPLYCNVQQFSLVLRAGNGVN
jgi:type II secretory pathway pseudopilin PulG